MEIPAATLSDFGVGDGSKVELLPVCRQTVGGEWPERMDTTPHAKMVASTR
jgi:hypothetical protein